MNQSNTSALFGHCAAAAILTLVLSASIGIATLNYFEAWYVARNLFNWAVSSLLCHIIGSPIPDFPIIPSPITHGAIGILLLSSITSLLLVWYFRIRNYGCSLFNHLDGPQLLSYKDAIQHYRKTTKGLSKVGLRIHPLLALPYTFEIANILVWGMQGSGKSNLIKSLVNQLKKRNERTAIYDLKGEYTELFFDENSLLLSPVDERTIYWNLGKDITDLGKAEAFAESVISSSTTQESFWVDSARVVLIGVISSLIRQQQPWSWRELADKLFCSDAKLTALLERHYPQAATLITPNDKTTTSIRSVIATQLFWVRNIDKSNLNSSNDFSVSDWLLDDTKKTLIVKGDINAPIMSQALVTALLSVVSNFVLSRSDDEATPIWLVVDELATINRSKSFEYWLAQGRSKGCRAIAGIQNLSQLYSIYGKEDASTLLGLFGNVVTFRLAVNGGSREVASKAFGNRRIEYRSNSISYQGENSYSLPQENIHVVKPEDISALPQPSLKKGIEGYLQLSGLNAAYRLRWPINHGLKKVTQASITPRKKTTKNEKNPINRLNKRRPPC